MPKVIVNTTPLIALCRIGCLDILQKMYHEIIIPLAVYQEITAKEDAVCMQVKAADDWIHVEQIHDITEKKMYKAKLHAGEVEVMILAQEQNADLVVIDDNAAKRTAKYLGFTVTGTLGILMKAKQYGMIESVYSLILKLKQNGFYISFELESRILKQVCENQQEGQNCL